MVTHFQLSNRLGGGIFPTKDEADAAARNHPVVAGADGYLLRSDVIEYEDGQQVFFNDEVKVEHVGQFKDKLAKLNRKAAKMGLPAIRAEFGNTRMVKVTREDPLSGARWTERYEVIGLRVIGQEIKIDGFEFFGRVDNEQGNALVCAVPGKEMPEKYRTLDNHCDHCRQARARKSYYIFKAEAGDFIKVGSTCLKDYMGHKAAHVLWLATLEKQIRDFAGGDLGSVPKRESTSLILALTAAVIRARGGYVSKAAAQKYIEAGGDATKLPPTSSHVSTQLQKPLPKGVERVSLLEVDRRTAQKAKAWFKAEVASKNDRHIALSDYEYNLNVLIDLPFNGENRLGILVSLIGVYLRKMGELAERKARDAGMVNAHIGRKGERRNFTGKYIGQNSFEGDYGTTYYTRFATPEGQVTVKSSTGWWGNTDLEKDLELTFKATIKDHKEWKGRLETVVNRAALV